MTSASHMTLASSPAAPFRFEIDIAGAAADARSRCFRIAGADPSTGAPLTVEYPLPGTTHEAYLDFHAAVARNFGLCLPRNRRDTGSLSHIHCTALITHNLTAEILYGYGDPAVLRVPAPEGASAGAAYYAVVTSNDAPNAFPLLRSRDLTQWEQAGFVFPHGNKPAWVANGEGISDFWAPELHHVEGEFRVYFAARSKHGGELAIGLARSSTPEGPFIAGEQPLLAGGVIDPHLHVDADGQAYLFWKEDANHLWPGLLSELLHRHAELTASVFPDIASQRTASLCQTLWPWVRTLHAMERFFVLQPLIEAATSDFPAFQDRLMRLAQRIDAPHLLHTIGREALHSMRTPIYGQRLAPDGATLTGDRAVVLTNDREWEAHLVEGAWVARHGRKYYLFYAGNDFSTADYGIGVAIADHPLGPYTKCDGPLLRSTPEWSGPGHPSVANGLDGEPQLFLHAFLPGHTGYKAFRALLTVPIAFKDDGVVLR